MVATEVSASIKNPFIFIKGFYHKSPKEPFSNN